MTGTVIAAPDKFRGSATAPAIAEAIAGGAFDAGWGARRLPLADGGEGTLDVFGGPNRTTTVTGPLGAPVAAGWRLDGDRAVIEMAVASGLLVAGGAAHNDPVAATTRGTGELIAAAIAAGATLIVVGVGGSATTDGGAGALQVLAPAIDGEAAAGGAADTDAATDRGTGVRRPVIPAGVRILVCADVRTRFTDAATVFGPQKGADTRTVEMLTGRLERLREDYERRFGVDVGALDGSGAAGGLAGGLAAIGAEIVPGFDTLAAAAGLDDALDSAEPGDLVVTGEGRFDDTSLAGKVVGGVIARAGRRGLQALVIAGAVDRAVRRPGILPPGVTVVSLVDRFGRESAWADPAGGVRRVVAEHLRSRS